MKNTLENNLANKVEEVLKTIRPFIHSHSGDVVVSRVEGTTVTLEVSGRCVDCVLADLTFNHMVKDLLNESVPEVSKVIFENAHAL